MDYIGSGDVYIPYALYTYKVLDRLQEQLNLHFRQRSSRLHMKCSLHFTDTFTCTVHALYILLYIHRKPSHTENTQASPQRKSPLQLC